MNRATSQGPVAGTWAARAATVAALLTLISASALAQTARDKYQQRAGERQTERESLFQLFAEPTLVLDVNQYQCGVRNQGDTCSDVFNSPTGGGGFWPTGSSNQYMFNSGLNLAGVIPADAGFAWAGDTTGAYFFDARGTQQHGEGITGIYNSLNPDDLASWPDFGSVPNFPDVTGFVVDEELFNPVLLGREAASQQDSWVMYWDGNPARSANREHPMGITVEQRTMAWNFPEGNEATIFFIYKFTNVTNNPFFQRINEAQFFGGENGLPDSGWQIDSIYVSFDVDPDVTADFDKNYSTAILPFNMGVAYEGEFQAPDFTYFPDLFRPPFFTNAPGLVGVKYLRSPIDPQTGEEVGLTLFTVHENPSSPGAQFFDPFGVQQLWRYLSGNIRTDLGDPPCTFTNPKQRRLCFLAQTPKDTRFLQASGPFSLGPGESQTVVVAQFAAATVETPLIIPGNTAANNPGTPTLRPGCAGEEIRPIEIGAGWVSTQSQACTETTGVIDQFKVDFVPGSLLGRALVAQTIFDNQFLLGFAPEPPEFFLIPGDDQVTVLWQASPTEQTGDPFFVAAGDPDNALFNPNYRQFDVEGYRVYRGTDPSRLQLIAQFDKRGTVFFDHSCETDPTVAAGDPCPAAGPDGIPGTDDDEPFVVDISSPFVQFPAGAVVKLADGSPFVTNADTALEGRIDAGSAEPMTNTGIPFSFVDPTARNGFQYFYRVTAFDINSLKSGPTSLESSGDTKSAFPQAPATNLELASFSSSITGDDGTPLNPNAGLPRLDSEDGTFDGPMPPTDAFELGFAPEIRRLLPAFTRKATIDSVVVKASGGDFGVQEDPTAICPEVANGLAASPFGACWDMHLTIESDEGTSQEVIHGYNPWWSAFGEPAEVDVAVVRAEVAFDAEALRQFQIPEGFGSSSAAVDAMTQEGIANSSAQGPQARRFLVFNGGSRWFDGTEETVPDPTRLIRVGHLDAVDTVWSPISHTPLAPGQDPVPNATAFEKQCFVRGLAFLGRAADVRFTWEGGTFGEVRDVTHHVAVPFSPKVGPTWGFLTTDANGNGFIDWQDFNFIDRGLQVVRQVDGGDCDLDDGEDTGFMIGQDPSPVDLVQTPSIVPVSTDGLDEPGITTLQQTGMGFGLYVNGERFIFEAGQTPEDGTVWTLRSYRGTISVDDETAADPSGYEFSLDVTGAGSLLRPALIPGLTFNFESEANTQLVGEPDLKQVHTVPDPYYAVSQFDLGPASKNLRFVNLPARATIRIYSVSGVLVDVINHNDPSGGGQATWNLRNRSNQFVASGVYFFHVVTPTGDEHIGKFTVVNFAN